MQQLNKHTTLLMCGIITIFVAGVTGAGAALAKQPTLTKPKPPPPPAGAVAATSLEAHAAISIAAYCKAIKAKKETCEAKPLARLRRPRAPFSSARVLEISIDGGNTTEARLAIVVDGKVYTKALAETTATGQTRYDASVKRLIAADIVPGGPLELRLDYSHSKTHETDVEGDMVTRWKKRLICGVGKSKRPSCLVLPLMYRYDFKSDKKHHRWRISARFDKKGRLIVKRRGAAPNDEDARALLGRHAIFFP